LFAGAGSRAAHASSNLGNLRMKPKAQCPRHL
jgi:hypothetical protein